MRTPTAECRKGHKMAGANILWHTRYDKTTRAKTMVRECRACANARYRAKRKARKRNQELNQAAIEAARNMEPPERIELSYSDLESGAIPLDHGGLTLSTRRRIRTSDLQLLAKPAL